jgi:hypothetical protein
VCCSWPALSVWTGKERGSERCHTPRGPRPFPRSTDAPPPQRWGVQAQRYDLDVSAARSEKTAPPVRGRSRGRRPRRRRCAVCSTRAISGQRWFPAGHRPPGRPRGCRRCPSRRRRRVSTPHALHPAVETGGVGGVATATVVVSSPYTHRDGETTENDRSRRWDRPSHGFGAGVASRHASVRQ